MPTPRRFARSDRETLRRLVDCGKLTPAQVEAFEEKYAQLVSGALTELSGDDRKSADIMYNEHKLGEQEPRRGRTNANQKELLAKFDAMPRPKKPPGK
jgi:hypothetical protein